MKSPARHEWTPQAIKALARSLPGGQKELALHIGIAQEHLSSWERGVWHPTKTGRRLLDYIAERVGYEG